MLLADSRTSIKELHMKEQEKYQNGAQAPTDQEIVERYWARDEKAISQTPGPSDYTPADLGRGPSYTITRSAP